MSNMVYEVIIRNLIREFRALCILLFVFRLKKDLTVQNLMVDELELNFRKLRDVTCLRLEYT